MVLQILYSMIEKNGRQWIEYSWRVGFETLTACFLRPPGLPPGDLETAWILRITKDAEWVIRPRITPNPRSHRPRRAGGRTSLDTLETSVNANLFDSM